MQKEAVLTKLKVLPDICVEELRITTEHSVSTVRVPTEVRTVYVTQYMPEVLPLELACSVSLS
jgi:hypothetical protein